MIKAIIFVASCVQCCFASIDLEERSQDFVLETKKIEIPGHPEALNASMIRWNGSILMSFRVIPDRKNSFISLLGLIWLDDDFSPISEPQILGTRTSFSLSPSRAGDGRLIAVRDRLYIVYDDNEDEKVTRGGFRVYVGEVTCERGVFSLKNIERLSRFEGASEKVREKSWVPFDYKGTLLLAYSIDPHVIFRPLLSGGECETVVSTKGQMDWDWGILRGGTPALEVDGRYLAFFHSPKEMITANSLEKKSLHYFMGAYTFNLEPPFNIEQMSPEPIIAKGFYKHTGFKPYWHPVRAIFPCGYILDGDYIWVSYGREDHEIWVAKLDKKGLFKSLKPIFSHAESSE